MQNQKGYTLAGRKIFFGIPAYDHKVSLKQAISLMRFAQEALPHGIQAAIGSICGCSVVSRARNLLVKDFLESDSTDLMFIDADINFDPQDIFRLLAWVSEPNIGIAAGIPCARKVEKTYIVTLDEENNQLTMNGMGLVRAKRVATAFMMIKREVLEKLVKDNPQWHYWDDKTERTLSAVFDFQVKDNSYVGEDYLFCDRARDAGFEVWVDPTIKLGHMGTIEYEGDFGKEAFYPRLVKDEKVSNG
jgi:hypothetical protein